MTADFDKLPQAWLDKLLELAAAGKYGQILSLLKQYHAVPSDTCACNTSYAKIKTLVDEYYAEN